MTLRKLFATGRQLNGLRVVDFSQVSALFILDDQRTSRRTGIQGPPNQSALVADRRGGASSCHSPARAGVALVAASHSAQRNDVISWSTEFRALWSALPWNFTSTFRSRKLTSKKFQSFAQNFLHGFNMDPRFAGVDEEVSEYEAGLAAEVSICTICFIHAISHKI